MKILWLTLLPLVSEATPNRVTLLDALKNNHVKLIATGNNPTANPTRSSHTGKCLKLQLTNTSTKPLEYHIENGYHLQSFVERLQDLVTTENRYVTLMPNQSQTIVVNALCAEKNNGSPQETDTFALAYKHTNSIFKLTNLLDQIKSYDNTAQQALWCFTDNNPIQNILDTNTDTLLENKLIEFVAHEKSIPKPTRRYDAIRQILYPLEIEGQYTHLNEHTTTIGFYLTDSANHIYRTIQEDDTETRRGTVKYSYLYRGQFPSGTYYFKMKKNGEWKTMKEIRL